MNEWISERELKYVRFRLVMVYCGYQEVMVSVKCFSLLSRLCPLLIFDRQGRGAVEGGSAIQVVFPFLFFTIILNIEQFNLHIIFSGGQEYKKE